MFSKPNNTENKLTYIKNQLFSDVLRSFGLDGFFYNSSICTGKNILIFDPSKFQYVKRSANVYSIDRVEYSFTKLEKN